MITSITSDTNNALATATATSVATEANPTGLGISQNEQPVIGNDNINDLITMVATAMVSSTLTTILNNSGDHPTLPYRNGVDLT